MTLKEIKAAIESGKKVYWSNASYTVIKDRHQRYLICHDSGSCIGLTGLDGVSMNGSEDDFFVS